HERLNLHHTANVILTIAPFGVRGFAAVGLRSPAEKFGIKLFRLFRVIRQQRVPAERSNFSFDAHALVHLWLPDTEVRAGRIGNDGHAADFHHVEGFLHDSAPERYGFGRRFISARDADV